MLTTICSNEEGYAGDTRIRKRTEKCPIPGALTHVTNEKEVTMEKLYEDLFTGTNWLKNWTMNALYDQVQHDLKLAGRDCAILSTQAVGRLFFHEKTRRVKDLTNPELASYFQGFLRMSREGRQAEWYKLDRIYFPRNIPNRHWYVIQFQCVRGKNGEPLRWEVNVFDSQAKESEIIKDAVGALTDVLEYALMSASEQDRSNDDLRLKLKVLREVKTVKNTTIAVPEQDDATSCGIYSVLNILLHGLGIEVTKETYTAFSGEVHLRWAFFAVLYNARTSGRDALYSNVSFENHLYSSSANTAENDICIDLS